MPATLASDHFTRPFADLDDVQARIGLALDFLDVAVVGRAVPADLSSVMVCARETLATLAAIRGPKRRAREFRAEHGVETMKDLGFAFADHAALLGLRAPGAGRPDLDSKIAALPPAATGFAPVAGSRVI